MHLITLLAHPEKRNLSEEQIKTIAGSNKYTILEAGVAAQFTAGQLPEVANGEFDIIIQKVSRKPIKLLLCDMESTIIENEFLDEIADHLGVGGKVAEITARAMNGELNFEEALRERIKLVAGLEEKEIANLINTRMKYNDGTHELIKWCNANGVYTMLVSGGFTAFTKVVAKELGFNEYHANELIFQNGKLKDVANPILGKEAKLSFLKSKSAEMGISLEETAAMGDGANDLPMLEAAGLGIAYKAKPKVKEVIKTQINYSSMACLKYLF